MIDFQSLLIDVVLCFWVASSGLTPGIEFPRMPMLLILLSAFAFDLLLLLSATASALLLLVVASLQQANKHQQAS